MHGDCPCRECEMCGKPSTETKVAAVEVDVWMCGCEHINAVSINTCISFLLQTRHGMPSKVRPHHPHTLSHTHTHRQTRARARTHTHTHTHATMRGDWWGPVRQSHGGRAARDRNRPQIAPRTPTRTPATSSKPARSLPLAHAHTAAPLALSVSSGTRPRARGMSPRACRGAPGSAP